MADRTSAEIFSRFFTECAKINDDTAKKIAAKAWKWSQAYDFSYEQMECDAALRKLGLNPDEET